MSEDEQKQAQPTSYSARELELRKELEHLAHIMELQPKPELGRCDWHRLARKAREVLQANK